MLNGLDPIIIFQFRKKLVVEELTNSQFQALTTEELEGQYIDLPPIPIYLSEKLTGLLVVSKDKSIDVETTTEALATGETPKQNQKPINTVVRINMEAIKDSIGLTLISAMADQIIGKLVSKEYSITFLQGATTVFNGKLHSFNISENANDSRANISVELVRGPTAGTKTDPLIVEVSPIQGPVPL